MKKLFVTTIFIAAAIASFAQAGITAGVNFAKYSYSSDRKAIISFNAGLQYRQAIAKHFSIQPELVYTVKGADVYPDDLLVLKYTNHINYVQLSVPAILSLQFSEEMNMKYEIGAGPYIAALTNASGKRTNLDGTTTNYKFKIGSSATDDFKRTDFGLQFIGGFVLADQFGFHLKYEAGLSDIYPNDKTQPLKTGNFSMNFSYKFKKGESKKK